jgi:hypothetical protein
VTIAGRRIDLRKRLAVAEDRGLRRLVMGSFSDGDEMLAGMAARCSRGASCPVVRRRFKIPPGGAHASACPQVNYLLSGVKSAGKGPEQPSIEDGTPLQVTFISPIARNKSGMDGAPGLRRCGNVESGISG